MTDNFQPLLDTPACIILKDLDDLIVLNRHLKVISPAYVKMLFQIRKHVAMAAAAEETEVMSKEVV